MGNRDEYVTLKVRREVKDLLLRMQALLQFKEKKRFSLSDIIAFLIANAPEIQIPLDESLRVVYPEKERVKNG